MRLYFAADHPTYSDLHQIAVEHDKLAELALEGDIEGYRKEMLSQFHNALGAQTLNRPDARRMFSKRTARLLGAWPSRRPIGTISSLKRYMPSAEAQLLNC